MMRILGKSSTVLGVDISSHFIRMVQACQEKGRVHLERMGETPIPEGTIDNGSIKDPELLSEIIYEMWKNGNYREKRTVSAVALQNVLVRTIKLPNMPLRELCTAARYKAAAMMPTSLRETVVQVASLGSPDDNGMVEVTVVASRRESVEGLARSLKSAGLKPVAVEIPVLSCCRVYAPRDDSVGILDILDSTASFSIFNGGCLKMCRVMTAGDIRKSWHRDSSPPNIRHIRSSGASSLCIEELDVWDADDLMLEISRSLEYYTRQFGPIQLDRLLVGAADDKFANLLSARLPFRVEPASMPYVVMPHLSADEAEHVKKKYAVAIGLAARKCC